MVYFLLGLFSLIIGAKLLVFGASQLASTLKISSLTIGLTIVAFGTSAPEIATCVAAALKGEGGLVMGNIIGSNIFNTLFVLGLIATIRPIYVAKKLIRIDVPIMIAVFLLFWAFAQNGVLNFWEGIILILAIIAYTWFAISATHSSEKSKARIPLYLQIIYILVGLILLTLGADWTVLGAQKIAALLNISSLLVGLTFVAIGTSLPELAASLMAIANDESEMAVGNVIGSNIFNLLAVAGISAIVAPKGVAIANSVLYFDLPVMLGAGIALFPIAITGHLIARYEGIILLLYYFLYLGYLIARLFIPAYLPLFSTAFFFFILPLTLLVIIITIYRHYKSRQ